MWVNKFRTEVLPIWGGGTFVVVVAVVVVGGVCVGSSHV